MRSASVHPARLCGNWDSGMVFHPYTAHPFSAIILSTRMTYQHLVGDDLIGRIVHLAQRQQICAVHAVQPDCISVPFSAGTDKHTGAEARGMVLCVADISASRRYASEQPSVARHLASRRRCVFPSLTSSEHNIPNP